MARSMTSQENAQQPLPVSAVIPAYNSAGTIGRAIASVAAQVPGFRPAEIIVVDDHSDDATADVARRLGATVIRHDVNLGAAAARNTAVDEASQPWIALLDADDEWLPNRLMALWPRRGEHVLLSGACVSVFDDDPDRPLEYSGTPSSTPHVVASPAELIPQNLVVASATIVRREAVLAAGGYDTTLKYAEDWDLWLRVLERGTGLLVPDVVALYHRHGAQKSQHRAGPAETHRRIVQGREGRSWFSTDVARRWSAVQSANAAKEAVAGRDWSAAARHSLRIARDPVAVREMVARKRRHRSWHRHSQRVQRELDADRAGMLADALADRLDAARSVGERSSGATGDLRAWLLQDWSANPELYWVRWFLVWFRLAQWADARLGRLSPLVVTPYWLITSLVLSVEFPATVHIGPRLRIFHLHGIVLHPRTRIGSDCVMRHGVTIGNRVDRDGREVGVATLGDHVDLGAGCAIVGDLHVGDHARVGALTVVLHSVPDGGVVVGNPGRVVRIDGEAVAEMASDAGAQADA